MAFFVHEKKYSQAFYSPSDYQALYVRYKGMATYWHEKDVNLCISDLFCLLFIYFNAK